MNYLKASIIGILIGIISTMFTNHYLSLIFILVAGVAIWKVFGVIAEVEDEKESDT